MILLLIRYDACLDRHARIVSYTGMHHAPLSVLLCKMTRVVFCQFSSIAIGINTCDSKDMGGRWKLVVDGVVKGLSELFGLNTSAKGLRERVVNLLSSWRMPQLLLKMCELQADDEDVSELLKVFLKALLSENAESKIREIRCVASVTPHLVQLVCFCGH